MEYVYYNIVSWLHQSSDTTKWFREKGRDGQRDKVNNSRASFLKSNLEIKTFWLNQKSHNLWQNIINILFHPFIFPYIFDVILGHIQGDCRNILLQMSYFPINIIVNEIKIKLKFLLDSDSKQLIVLIVKNKIRGHGNFNSLLGWFLYQFLLLLISFSHIFVSSSWLVNRTKRYMNWIA